MSLHNFIIFHSLKNYIPLFCIYFHNNIPSIFKFKIHTFIPNFIRMTSPIWLNTLKNNFLIFIKIFIIYTPNIIILSFQTLLINQPNPYIITYILQNIKSNFSIFPYTFINQYPLQFPLTNLSHTPTLLINQKPLLITINIIKFKIPIILNIIISIIIHIFITNNFYIRTHTGSKLKRIRLQWKSFIIIIFR